MAYYKSLTKGVYPPHIYTKQRGVFFLFILGEIAKV